MPRSPKKLVKVHGIEVGEASTNRLDALLRRIEVGSMSLQDQLDFLNSDGFVRLNEGNSAAIKSDNSKTG